MSDPMVRLHAPPHSTGHVALGTRTAPADRSEVIATIAGLLDQPRCVELTSSCTHALEAAAILTDVGPGDEVIVPAFTFPSSASAFLMRGAKIRFADVDSVTANIDPRSVERLTTGRTRVVVCVHYGGVAADMDALADLERTRGWTLVEDAAQGLFGRYRSNPLGRFGQLGCLSFDHTKNISSVDGGALVINDESLVDRAQIALDKGTNRAAFEAGTVDSYEWSGPGSAFRMSDPLVGLLAEQLDIRERIQTRRHEVWNTYIRGLAEWGARTGTALPVIPSEVEHPAHLFWLLLPEHVERSSFVSHCGAQGVQVARHFGSLPRSGYGRSIADPADKCPVSERFAEKLVRLPLHPNLDDNDVERVLDAVESFG